MVISNMHEAKTHLFRLIQKALEGEEVIIAKAGEPLVRLKPYESEENPRKPGIWEGEVWMSDDLNEEYDFLLQQRD